MQEFSISKSSPYYISMGYDYRSVRDKSEEEISSLLNAHNWSYSLLAILIKSPINIAVLILHPQFQFLLLEN